MSVLAEAMIVNAVVLLAVLQADLGQRRKIGTFRLFRPLILAALIVPVFMTALTGQGRPLKLEVGGVFVGLIAASLMGVYRDPQTARPVSRAGAGYATVWVVVIGARAAFSFGSHHWFGAPLARWLMHHQVSADDITNTLVLMAVAMVLTRTVAMATRAATLPLPVRIAVRV